MPADSPSTPRKRAAHLGPDRRRPEVLNTALRIAVDEGLGAVSIASVAAAMGVTRPVLYSCFADRFALVSALLERESAHLITALLGALHNARGDDPEQVFIDGFRGLLDMVAQSPDGWLLFAAGNPDPEIARTFTDGRKVITAATTRWLAPALKQWWNTDDLRRKTPALIEFFMSSCEAAVEIMLDPSNDLTADDLAPLFGRMLVSAYQAA